MLCKFLLSLGLLAICMAQPSHATKIEVQRTAMRKLHFLVGSWSGEARLWRGPGEATELTQTEEATYKLDGLLLTIEGVGKNKADSQAALQALGLISYDDESGVYRMRAFNEGRWLETEVRLDDAAKSLHWGFIFGQIKTNSTLRINERGEWTEVAEMTMGSEPPRKIMEMTVKRK
jgi:hypothetical protein